MSNGKKAVSIRKKICRIDIMYSTDFFSYECLGKDEKNIICIVCHSH